MSGDVRQRLCVIAAIAILLLLLWRLRSPLSHTFVLREKPTNINVVTSPINYTLPPLVIPRGNGPWDWMQTTDLSCGCDVGLWKQPFELAPSVALPQSYPVFKYIYGNGMNAAPDYNFPSFAPPPLPTFWTDWADQSNGQGPGVLYHTSDGNWFRLGKYGTFAFNTHRYTEYNLSGDNLYYNGKRYVRDSSRDRAPPYVLSQPSNRQG